MPDALLILRTPLQAHLARQVIEKEEIKNYDLIYLTQNNSQEDQFYFSKLSDGLGCRKYVFVPPMRVDVLNHFKFRQKLHDCFKDFRRDLVIVGSVDAPVISALTRKQKISTLVTIDDGSANVNKGSAYHNPERSIRYKIYEYLLRAETFKKIRNRIDRHYTLFQGLENIVGKDRLRYLPSICPEIDREIKKDARIYFIGWPVPDKYRDLVTASVKEFLGERKIDSYVRHPREETPLNFAAPLLEKGGRIAEEAILLDAAGREVHILSTFSTCALNLAPFVASSTVFIRPGVDQKTASEMERVAKLCCCAVRRF